MDIFGGHHKISMHFGSFLRSRYRIGGIWGLLKFQIFLGVLEIPVFFFLFFILFFFLRGGG